MTQSTKTTYKASIDSTSGKKSIYGYVIDLNDRNKAIKVNLKIDNKYITNMVCDTYKKNVETIYGVGNHGFKFEIPDKLRDGQIHAIEISNAHNGIIILEEKIKFYSNNEALSREENTADKKAEKTAVSSVKSDNKVQNQQQPIIKKETINKVPATNSINEKNIKGWISDKFDDSFSLKGWLISTENTKPRTAIIEIGSYKFDVECSSKRLNPKDYADHANNGFSLALSLEQIFSLPNIFTLKFIDKASGKVLADKQVKKNIDIKQKLDSLIQENKDLKNNNVALNEKFEFQKNQTSKMSQEFIKIKEECKQDLELYKTVFFNRGVNSVKNSYDYEIGSKFVKLMSNSNNKYFTSKLLSDIEKLGIELNSSKEEIELSVIIPVFNTEKYLSKCLDSVLSQNIERMEVICVDDGSTDNSLKILEEYKNKDPRVKVIKQSNRFAGAARNIGLKNCSGKYVHFLDSDDWVCDSAYADLLKEIKINNSDVVMFTYYKYDNVSGEVTTSTCFDNLPKSMQYQEVNANNNIEFFLKSAVMPWNKIYKTEFLIKNNLVFDEIMIANDRTFYFGMLSKNPKIVITNQPYINYRINNKDSLVGEARLKHFDCHYKCFNNMRDIYFKTQNYPVILDLFFKDLMYFYQKASVEQKNKIKIDTLEYIEHNKDYFKIEYFDQNKASFYFFNMLIDELSIPIVFGVDKNYLPYLSVALLSMIENSSDLFKYDVYILHTELDETDIKTIKRLETSNVHITCINVLKEIDSIDLYSRAHYSISMYYRILIPQLFSNLNKVVYLDCDILVVDDISKLYFSYIGNNYVSAAINYLNRDMQKYVRSNLKMDYPDYVNSGILIINIAEWKKNKVSEKIFNYIENNKWLVCPDQDAINVVCKNKIKYLSSSWNFTWQHIVLDTTLPYQQQLKFDEDELQQKSIIHYTSGIKPWKKLNWDGNEYGRIWWVYAKRSPYYEFIYNSIKI